MKNSFHVRAWIGVLAAVFLFPASSGWSADADSHGIVRGPKGEPVMMYGASHALLIAASRYRYWPGLDSVSSEMDAVEAAMRGQGFAVTRVNDPDARTLRNAFQDFVDQYGFDKNNRLLFFFSGHGHSRERKGFLVPVDAPAPRDDEKEFLRKAVTMDQILAWARRVEAKHALFLFDSCFSGAVFKAKALPAHPPQITDYTSRPVRQFITAGDAGQEVPARTCSRPRSSGHWRGKGI